MAKTNVSITKIKEYLRAGYGSVKTMKDLHISHPILMIAVNEMKAKGERIPQLVGTRSVKIGTKYQKMREKNLNHEDLSSLPRHTKEGWIRYMLANPFYFESYYSHWSEERVRKIAEIEFKDDRCLCCGKTMHKIKCIPELIEDSVLSIAFSKGEHGVKNAEY